MTEPAIVILDRFVRSRRTKQDQGSSFYRFLMSISPKRIGSRMTEKKINKDLTTVIFVCLCLLAPASALADDSVGVSVTPAQASIAVDPGGINSVILHVTNTTKIDQAFEAFAVDYNVTNNQIALAAPATNSDSFAPFAKVTPTRFDLVAGETKSVTVQFMPGIDQAPNKYRGAVEVGPVATAAETQNSIGAQIGVTGKVATLIGVTVSGNPTANRSDDFVTRVFGTSIPRELYFALALVLVLLLGVIWAVKYKKKK